MNDSSDDRNPVEMLAEEFLDRQRRGEKPTMREYCERNPDLADEIRLVFPALCMVEDLKPEAGQITGEFRREARAKLERIGDYRLIREVGRGGMGIVYEAEQESLGRHVALKLLPTSALLDQRQLARFQRESKAAARLHHTNIVPVYGVGTHDGTHYYVMQFIQGLGLDEVLEELRRLREGKTASSAEASAGRVAVGRAVDASLVAQGLVTGEFRDAIGDADGLPQRARSNGETRTIQSAAQPSAAAYPQTASASSSSIRLPGQSSASSLSESGRQYWYTVARIGMQVADALAYANSQGTLHRDIKPANLLLDTQGNVWVTDFGLAKAIVDQDNLTHTGDIVGTLRYMAPERFHGQGDARSDIYSLGLTLYEMATLQPAFDERHREKLVHQVMHDEPPRPRKLNKAIPQDLETIILKAIAREAGQRYATAIELAEDLQCFVADEPIKARRIGSGERLVRWCRRNPTVAVLTSTVFVLLVCAAAGSTVAALWLQAERDAALAAEDRARKEAGKACAAEARAREEEDAKTEKLYQSYVEGAKASRFSRQAGQRFATLDAIRKAAQIARDRNMPAERFDELRNLAIACLALPDFRTLHEWEAFPRGAVASGSDPQCKLYARLEPGALLISVRRVKDDQEVAQVPTFADTDGLLFSATGRYLIALGGWRKRLWDLSESEPKLLFDRTGVHGVSFDPHEKHAVFGLADGSIIQLDLSAPKQPPLTLAKLGQGPVHWPLFDPADTTRMAAIQNDKVCVLDVTTGAVLSWIPEPMPAKALAWHPSGTFLAIACGAVSIHVWDVARRQRVAVLDGCRSGGIRLAFSSDGELLLGAGWEGKLRFWRWRTGQQFLRHPGGAHLELDPIGRLLIVEGKRARVVEVTSGREYRALVRQTNTTSHLSYWPGEIHPDGRLLAVPMTDGVRFWDLATGNEIGLVRMNYFSRLAFAASDGLLTNGIGGLVYWPLRRTQTDAGEYRLGPPWYWGPGQWWGFGVSKDGQVVAQPNGDSGSLVWNARQVEKPVALRPQQDVRDGNISSDGRFVAAASRLEAGGVKVWEAVNGRFIREFPVGRWAEAVFSPDGRWLVVEGDLGRRMVRVGTWEEVTIVWPAGRSTYITFSPDSRLMALASADGLIRLLEPATGREKARLEDPNQDSAGTLAFTPDGTRLVAVSDDAKAVNIWDLRLIREQLAELGLDWDEPPYPPAPPPQKLEPLRVTVVGGEMINSPPAMLTYELQTYSLGLLGNPFDAELYFQRGRIYFQMNNPGKAMPELNMALALQPDHAGARFVRGKLHQARREWEVAIDDYSALLQRQPNDPQVHSLRGVCRDALGDYVEAARDLGECIKYGNENAILLNNIAWRLIRYSKDRKNAELALPLIEQADRQSPDQAFQVHTLGVNYYRLGRYQEALSTLERAGKLEKPGPTAAVLYFQAMCRFKLDDPAGAKRDFEQAIRWHEAAKLTPPLAEEMQSFRAEAAAVLKKLPE
jgi:WD40 repeat protein/tetratricopeptide (TPR) repeat protein